MQCTHAAAVLTVATFPQIIHKALAVAPCCCSVDSGGCSTAGIISIQGVLSADECRGLVRAAEGGGMTLQTSRGPKFGEAHRHHQRTSYDDSSFAQQLWDTGLSAAAAELRADDDRKPVGLNPNIRIYSYSPGDLFGPHYDVSGVEHATLQSRFARTWLALLYSPMPLSLGKTHTQLRGWCAGLQYNG